MGVDLFLGHAKFVSKNEVEINGKTLKFLKACIATGGRPFVPPIEGLSDIKFHTSDSIFNLEALPASMLVLGCGPIGCELGQGFARLGTNVTMVSNSFMPKEDSDCSIYVQK
jgi:pyruvate/2-oxoglutarate dehydrogenase complex dihydrolipoamide dehydrogenase (E3) component